MHLQVIVEQEIDIYHPRAPVIRRCPPYLALDGLGDGEQGVGDQGGLQPGHRVDK